MVVALVHELGRMTLDEVAHLCRHWRRPVPWAPQLLWPWALQLLRPWALQFLRP